MNTHSAISTTIDVLLSGQIWNFRRAEMFTRFPLLGHPDFPGILQAGGAMLAGGDPNEARLLATLSECLRLEQRLAIVLADSNLGVRNALGSSYVAAGDSTALNDPQNADFARSRIANQVRTMDRAHLQHLVGSYDRVLLDTQSMIRQHNASLERTRAVLQSIGQPTGHLDQQIIEM
jgi:hypothetical protein